MINAWRRRIKPRDAALQGISDIAAGLILKLLPSIINFHPALGLLLGG